MIYTFPTHIVSTDLRPDIVWWDDTNSVLGLVELTIPFETSFNGAVQRKETKYEDIITSARCKGYQTSLITLEVGPRGVLNSGGFKRLKNTIPIPDRDLSALLITIIRKAIEGSFKIWVDRNKLQ